MLSAPLPYSIAFEEYVRNRHEVIELLHAVPSDTEQIHSNKKRELANALYRASVVLLSSHLERYIESLVVEAIDAINFAMPTVDQLPELLRLTQIEQSLRAVHSAVSDPRDPDKVLDKREMINKVQAFKAFLDDYDYFFNDSQPCTKLNVNILIDRFSNPSPHKIVHLFRQFGFHNVVQRAISRESKPDKANIEGMVNELIEKRNAIAHTGMTTNLTRENIIVYLRYSRRLVRGIDTIVGQEVEKIVGKWPWDTSFLLGSP